MRILGNLVPDLRPAKWLSKYNSLSLKPFFFFFKNNVGISKWAELVSVQKPTELSPWGNCALGTFCAVLLNPHRIKSYLHWFHKEFCMWKLLGSLGHWRIYHLCSFSYFNPLRQAPGPAPHLSEYRELPQKFLHQKMEEYAASLIQGWWKSEEIFSFPPTVMRIRESFVLQGTSGRPQASAPGRVSAEVWPGCWGQSSLESHQSLKGQHLVTLMVKVWSLHPVQASSPPSDGSHHSFSIFAAQQRAWLHVPDDLLAVTGRLLLGSPKLAPARPETPNSLSLFSQDSSSDYTGTLAHAQLVTFLICFPSNLFLSQLCSIASQLRGNGAC